MILDEKIIELYQSGKSTYEIAELIGNGYYANKCRRRLIALGIKLRDKANAQKNVLQSGRASHPTLGKHHSIETKSKIGEKISEGWAAISEEEKIKRSLTSRVNWDRMTDEEKERFRELSAKAIRKASVEGSKAEKYLLAKLRKEGWRVEFHTDRRLPIATLQVDLFLPDILTAIECDGPNHAKPIWGMEAYTKTIASDQKKNSLLMVNGYNLIRINIKINKISNVYMNKIWNKLSPILDKLKENFRLPIEERLIIIKGDDNGTH